MNTPRTLIASSLVSLAALFAATGAVAQEATPDHWNTITSTASRAEVSADARTALRAGLIETGEATLAKADFVSTKSRAQVQAEAAAAMRLGVLGHGEQSAPSITPAQAEQIRSAGLRALSVPLAQVGR